MHISTTPGIFLELPFPGRVLLLTAYSVSSGRCREEAGRDFQWCARGHGGGRGNLTRVDRHAGDRAMFHRGIQTNGMSDCSPKSSPEPGERSWWERTRSRCRSDVSLARKGGNTDRRGGGAEIQGPCEWNEFPSADAIVTGEEKRQ